MNTHSTAYRVTIKNGYVIYAMWRSEKGNLFAPSQRSTPRGGDAATPSPPPTVTSPSGGAVHYDLPPITVPVNLFKVANEINHALPAQQHRVASSCP
jgi:hypothetical protein